MFLPLLLLLDLRISRLMIRFPSCVIVGKPHGLQAIPKWPFCPPKPLHSLMLLCPLFLGMPPPYGFTLHVKQSKLFPYCIWKAPLYPWTSFLGILCQLFERVRDLMPIMPTYGHKIIPPLKVGKRKLPSYTLWSSYPYVLGSRVLWWVEAIGGRHSQNVRLNWDTYWLIRGPFLEVPPPWALPYTWDIFTEVEFHFRNCLPLTLKKFQQIFACRVKPSG
jgi:hypothetical protein